MFDLVLDKALEKCGSSKALAIELEVSAPDITRFRSGESGMKLSKLSKLIKISGLKITPADREQKLKTGLQIMAELFLEESKQTPWKPKA